MKRYLISLALWMFLCVCFVASAYATPAPPLSACVPVAPPQAVSLAVGMHVAFVCAGPYSADLSCLHSTCNPKAFMESVLRVAAAPDRAKAVDAEWAANVKWTCDAPPNHCAKTLCAERKAWISANWAEWTKP